MPRLNKCKYRKEVNGYVERSKSKMRFSTKRWFKCLLLEQEIEDPVTHYRIKCKGWNCGRYEENDSN